MTRHGKFLVRLLSGSADQALRFEELRALLRRLGFTERHRGGSHHIFTRDGVVEILNLQPRGGGEAKAYQVKQVRDIILRYQLAAPFLGEAERDDDEA
ncbi:MAG: type II toxin-antitoxin system HicA family toxin [Gemmatimonadaceae bacterium]|nr:type II toxin-antitoxin system HicA family toxin [Gemmatimonadaceae bacterium]